MPPTQGKPHCHAPYEHSISRQSQRSIRRVRLPYAAISAAREEFTETLQVGVRMKRAVKEAVHELGHTCGLGHCRDPKCVMFFPNALYDTDVKGPGFCAACRLKVDRGVSG